MNITNSIKEAKIQEKISNDAAKLSSKAAKISADAAAKAAKAEAKIVKEKATRPKRQLPTNSMRQRKRQPTS